MRSDHDWALYAVVCIGVMYSVFCLSLLPIAAQDFRMVNVFSIDEADIVTYVWNLYVTGGETRPSFKYGAVFYYVPVLMLYIWSFVGSVSEQMTIWVVRLFCFFSGLGCLWFTYVLGREFFDQWAGAIAVFLLASGATFLRWSVESHPDLPQLFFLLGSLLFAGRCARNYHWKWWVWAGVFAGLAFGTKYGGVFLLPVLVVSVFGGKTLDDVRANLKQLWRWGVAVAIPAVFVLSFALTNPMAVQFPVEFFSALAAEKEIMEFGHRVAATFEPWRWLTALWAMIGTGHGVVLLGTAGWLIFKERRSGLRADRVVLIFWTVLFVGYLMVESQLKRPRHLLPVLPGLLVFVGAAYMVIVKDILKGWKWKYGVPVGIAILSVGHLQASATFFADRWGREEDRVEIVVGKWLDAELPEETTILFDVYAYVPSKFQNVYRTVGMSYPLVNHYEPEFLVVRDAVVNDYADPNEAQIARQGPLGYMDRHYFYRYLQQGLLPAYQLVRDFGTVAVYQRKMPLVRTEGELRQRWRFLVKEDRDGRHYGLVGAHWTMGYVHESQGKIAEANAEYERARKSNNFGKRLYSHGAYLLSNGYADMARHAFKAGLEASKGEALLYRAGMHEDLAFRYFRAGLYEDMLTTASDALRLTDNLPAATFEVAVANLVLGKTEFGMLLFDDGVRRFGRHEKGKRLLEVMVEMEKEKEVATRLIAQYYGAKP